jgi:hypothetical protein
LLDNLGLDKLLNGLDILLNGLDILLNGLWLDYNFAVDVDGS